MRLLQSKFAGLLLLLPALPAVSQDAKDCVPCGKPATTYLTVPVDPILLVVVFAIGLVAGVAIAAIILRRKAAN